LTTWPIDTDIYKISSRCLCPGPVAKIKNLKKTLNKPKGGIKGLIPIAGIRIKPPAAWNCCIAAIPGINIGGATGGKGGIAGRGILEGGGVVSLGFLKRGLESLKIKKFSKISKILKISRIFKKISKNQQTHQAAILPFHKLQY